MFFQILYFTKSTNQPFSYISQQTHILPTGKRTLERIIQFAKAMSEKTSPFHMFPEIGKPQQGTPASRLPANYHLRKRTNIFPSPTKPKDDSGQKGPSKPSIKAYGKDAEKQAIMSILVGGKSVKFVKFFTSHLIHHHYNDMYAYHLTLPYTLEGREVNSLD